MFETRCYSIKINAVCRDDTGNSDNAVFFKLTTMVPHAASMSAADKATKNFFLCYALIIVLNIFAKKSQIFDALKKKMSVEHEGHVRAMRGYAE